MWNLNRTLLKKISTELFIQIMLFWQEKIKTRENILMIFLYFILIA